MLGFPLTDWARECLLADAKGRERQLRKAERSLREKGSLAKRLSRRRVPKGLERMREIGASIAVSPEATTQFEHKFIDPWLAEHPLRDITFVRESPIERFAEQSRARGDTFQSIGTMEELTFALSQQARIYLADLPRQVRAEVDLCDPMCCLLKGWRRCRATCT